ncbi:hypothetical protein [Rhodococcus qingshengii]
MPREPHVRETAATAGGGTTFRSSRRTGARQRCTSFTLPRVL